MNQSRNLFQRIPQIPTSQQTQDSTTDDNILSSHEHPERHGGCLLNLFSSFFTHNNRNVIMTWKDSLIDFTAGSVGGCSGKLLDYPLDTVKVRLQTQSALTEAAKKSVALSGKAPPLYYTGAIHCLRHTIKTDGYMSLYRGISAPLIGSMAECAVLFVVYSEIKKQLGEKPGEPPLTLLQMSISGGIAGGFTPFVLTPFELVKCRLQTVGEGFRTYKGPMDVVIQTIKEEGFFRGLYRGNMSMLLREVPGNFCWYGVYEGVCKLMTPNGGSKADLGMSAHLLGGAYRFKSLDSFIRLLNSLWCYIVLYRLTHNPHFLSQYCRSWSRSCLLDGVLSCRYRQVISANTP